MLRWICFLFLNLKRWLEGHFNGLGKTPRPPPAALEKSHWGFLVRSRAELMEDPDATRRLWDLGVPRVVRNGKNSSLVLGRALGTPSSGPPVCPALGTRGQQGVPPKHPQLPGGAAQLGTGDKEGTAEGAGPAELWGGWGQSWFAQGVAVPCSAPLARGRAVGSAGKGCIHGICSWLRAPGAAGAPETLSSSGGLVGGGSVAFVDVEGPIM